MGIMKELFVTGGNIAEVFMAFLWCRTILETRLKKRYVFWTAGILYFFCYHMPGSGMMNFVKMAGFYAIILLLFRGGIAQKLYMTMTVFGIFSSGIYIRTLCAELGKMPYNAALYSSCIMIEAVLFLGISLLIGEAKKTENYGWIGLIFSCMWGINMGWMRLAVESPFSLNGKNQHFLIAVFTGVNLILFLYYEKNCFLQEEIKRKTLFIEKCELEQRHFQRLEQIYHEFKGLTHDITRYLNVLTAMEADAKDDKKMGGESAVSLIDEIKERILGTEQYLYCARPVLNSILNEKKKTADEKQIDYEVFVEAGFDLERMSDFSLIGILSNLIDNALEAAEKADKEKWIKICMYRINEEKNFIKIENSIAAGKDEAGMAETVYGYGLKNVQRLVEENCGVMRIEKFEKAYRVEIII